MRPRAAAIAPDASLASRGRAPKYPRIAMRLLRRRGLLRAIRCDQRPQLPPQGLEVPHRLQVEVDELQLPVAGETGQDVIRKRPQATAVDDAKACEGELLAVREIELRLHRHQQIELAQAAAKPPRALELASILLLELDSALGVCRRLAVC